MSSFTKNIRRRKESEPTWNPYGDTPIPDLTLKLDSTEPKVNDPKNITSGFDSVNPIGMSYWPVIQNIPSCSYIRVLVSIKDKLHIFTVNKITLAVEGVLAIDILHTGEGCFWSRDEGQFYVPEQYSIWKYDLFGNKSCIFLRPYKVWQLHCDFLEEQWSYTRRDINDFATGWGVFNTTTGEAKHWGFIGKPDECQIDKSGKYLLCKEDDVEGREGNRIINIENGLEQFITDRQGALGHSDNGFGCMIGENDQDGNLTGWNLNLTSKVYLSPVNQWNMGYVSFCNALNIFLRDQFCIVSGGNDHNIYKVLLDRVEPKLMYFDQSENNEDDNRARANIDYNGEFIAWTAWLNGKRECFVGRVI